MLLGALGVLAVPLKDENTGFGERTGAVKCMLRQTDNGLHHRTSREPFPDVGESRIGENAVGDDDCNISARLRELPETLEEEYLNRILAEVNICSASPDGEVLFEDGLLWVTVRPERRIADDPVEGDGESGRWGDGGMGRRGDAGNGRMGEWKNGRLGAGRV